VASKIALIAATIHFLFSAFYLFVGFRLSELYSSANVEPPNPIFGNWLFLMFVAFTILDILLYLFIRNKQKQQQKFSLGIPLAIILLIGPFLIFLATSIYANYQVAKTLQNSY